MADPTSIARLKLVKTTILAADAAVARADQAVRRIRGLEKTATFDQHVRELSAPPGWERTQSGLLIPVPGSDDTH